jgi:hypothetical protein
MTVHPRPSLLAAVRHRVKDSLLQTRAAYDVDDVVLLADELVTNAIVHAKTFIVLTLDEAAGRLHVEVQDEAPHSRPVAVTSPPEALEEHGRGLGLVRALAHEWGVYDLICTYVDTKVLWFDVLPVSADLGSPELRTDEQHVATVIGHSRQ